MVMHYRSWTPELEEFTSEQVQSISLLFLQLSRYVASMQMTTNKLQVIEIKQKYTRVMFSDYSGKKKKNKSMGAKWCVQSSTNIKKKKVHEAALLRFNDLA